jgi:hypothetical protein
MPNKLRLILISIVGYDNLGKKIGVGTHHDGVYRLQSSVHEQEEIV